MNDTSQDIKQVDKHCTAEEFLLNDDNSPQTKMVRKAYNEMDCMFGTYVPHYVPFMVKSLGRLIVTCLAAVLFWTFINAILSSASIGAKIGFAFAMVPVFAFWVYRISGLTIIGRQIYHDLGDLHWLAIAKGIYESISQYAYSLSHLIDSSSSRKIRKYSIGFWNS